MTNRIYFLLIICVHFVLESSGQGNAGNDMLLDFENFSRELAALPSGTKLKQKGLEIYVISLTPPVDTFSRNLNLESHVKFKFESNDSFLSLPTIGSSDKFARSSLNDVVAVIARWKNMNSKLKAKPPDFCQPPYCEVANLTDISVLTVSYYNTTDTSFPKLVSLPLNYSMRHSKEDSMIFRASPPLRRIQGVRRECVWWDDGVWSKKGCHRAKDENHDFVSCVCSHTTSFSTLLLYNVTDIPEWTFLTSKALQSVSIAFLTLAVVFLGLARASKGLDASSTYYSVGMRNNRSVSQISLCVSLIALHLSTMLADVALDNTPACYLIAASQHVFLLTSAMWLLNEAVTITLKTHLDYGMKANYKTLTVCQLLAAWVAPMLYVTVCLAIFQDTYLPESPAYEAYTNLTGKTSYPKYNQCWINSDGVNVTIYSVIVPTAVIVLTNLLLLVRMIGIVYRVSKQNNIRHNAMTACNRRQQRRASLAQGLERKRHWKSVIKSYFMLFPVSTLPWVMWLLGNVSLVFVGAHTIINGLQGVGIFLVLCIFSDEERNRLLRLWKRCRAKQRCTRKVTLSRPYVRAQANSPEQGNVNNDARLTVPRNSNDTVVSNISST